MASLPFESLQATTTPTERETRSKRRSLTGALLRFSSHFERATARRSSRSCAIKSPRACRDHPRESSARHSADVRCRDPRPRRRHPRGGRTAAANRRDAPVTPSARGSIAWSLASPPETGYPRDHSPCRQRRSEPWREARRSRGARRLTGPSPCFFAAARPVTQPPKSAPQTSSATSPSKTRSPAACYVFSSVYQIEPPPASSVPHRTLR